LAAAWRIGGLRARLTDEVQAALGAADAQLTAVRPLPELSSEHLLEILVSLKSLLVDLHTLEVLAASLSSTTRGTLAGSALQALRQGRLAGLGDATITADHPVVLSLTPPRVGEPFPLPEGMTLTPLGTQAPPGLRELLRLRVRWAQELQARVATEIGRRAELAGHLPDPDAVAWLTVDELTNLVQKESVPADLDARRARRSAPPLPTHFRMSTDGSVVPVERPGARPAGGVGAGGGRGTGTVTHADTLALERPGSVGRVLVVRTLDPTLAGLLPGLAGLVAESGSTLSHLAILAREYGVPTVVAVHDAVHRFPVGMSLLVDGQTGEVRLLTEEVP
jgi:pyruvate,water dikinase